MGTSFDATLKVLLEESPTDWPALVGHPVRSARVIDADIATVSGAADRVILVEDEPRWILHVEFQTSHDPTLARRINVYNSVLEHRHELPVRSVAILLRRDAYRPGLDGVYRRLLPGETEPYRVCHYDVIRMWEVPPERLFAGGPSMLPLVPISAMAESELPSAIRRISGVFDEMADQDEANVLKSAIFILMGLRFDRTIAKKYQTELLAMKESSTYQMILEEGEAIGLQKGLAKGLAEGQAKGLAEGQAKGLAEGQAKGLVEGLRQSILDLGEQHIGSPPGEPHRELIAAMTGPDQLRSILRRVLTAHSWDELLAPLN